MLRTAFRPLVRAVRLLAGVLHQLCELHAALCLRQRGRARGHPRRFRSPGNSSALDSRPGTLPAMSEHGWRHMLKLQAAGLCTQCASKSLKGKWRVRRLPQTGARAGEKEVRVQAVEKGRTGTTAERRLALAVQSSPIFSAAVGCQPTHRRTVLGMGSSGLEWLAANQTNELPLLRTPLLAPGRFRILNTPS